MSIETQFQPARKNRATRLPDIMPGRFGSVSDYSEGSRNTISIHCLPEDNGAQIYYFDNRDFPENKIYRVIPAEMYIPRYLLAEIPAGGNFERDIVTEARHRGRLILQHVLNV